MTTLGGGRVIGSTICSNKCFGASDYGYGGGAYCYVMTNCTVFANYGRHGGGVSQCNAYKCDFHDNYATGYGGGAHGGAAGGRAEKCTFGANISGTAGGGHNTYAMELVDCDVSYAGVYSGLATGCTFHDIGRKAVIDNPYVVAAVTNSDVYTGIPICTNCLFVNNRQEWYYDRNYPQSYGQSMFKGVDNAKRKAQIVNCTVVSNTVGQTFSYCRTPDSPWNVENSVFFGNVCHWGAGDLVNYDHNITNGIFFTSCAYGIAGGKFSSAGPSIWTKAGETNYKFGANGFPAKPGFLYERDPDAEHPFSIWRTSPLRGRGAVEDWMNVAYDIRGEADDGKYMRLRDGKCDIGCYQCWEKIPGFAISFR